MEEIEEFLEKFFEMSSFPARWHCGRWSEFHGWLYIISDIAIWAAYFTIPFILLHFLRRKKDLPFRGIIWLFGAFILACGATHLIDAIIFWFPIYRVSAIVRLLTAIVSWATIFALYRVIPQALLLRTPAEMERVVVQRTDELNATIKKMKFMADAMPQMVYTARPDGTRDYFNRRTIEFTGKSLDELMGWKWTEFLHPDDRQSFLKRWMDAIEKGVAFESENRIMAADGNFYWHLTRAVPHYDEDGKVACWVGTATEIEQQKRASEILENIVAERTEELRVANSQLLQSNRDLESFAGFASHDLQAPLRTISTYLSMVRDNSAAVLDENSNKMISRAIDASQRMRNLIETLLQYSKVNASIANREEVDLEAIIEVIRININDASDNRKAQISYGKLHKVHADESLMGQLLQNLISNGINYNDKDLALIDIQTQETDHEIIISIADNGIGIDKKDLDTVFNVFTRLQSNVQGTGLGLSISRRIVDKHHGRLWLESEPGRGTTFFIAIPKNDSEKE